VKVLFLTNEYPPNVYGGAGVHVDYLTRELAKSIDVEVRCFGRQASRDGRLEVHGHAVDSPIFEATDPRLRGALDALACGVSFAAVPIDADVVHCHTWYSHFGGIAAKLAYGKPLVVTVHSLEPLRPWKREQLGRGYEVSCWVERTALEMADAVIAVSAEAGRDISRLFDVGADRLRVIHNGIDAAEYDAVATKSALKRYGVDPRRPYVLFVGRVTRQKGILHLVRAIPHLGRGVQVVLCAGAPDTREIAEEMAAAVAAVQAERPRVIWIREMLDKPSLIELYSHAAVFCCPSIYEPFGLINLEAMACSTPVVASAVGGIKEVVVPGETGLLVEIEQDESGEPRAPDRFARGLAAAIDRLIADPALRERMGAAGRRRAVEVFSWAAVAGRTADLYATLVG
jgi:starch synthase